MRRAVAGLILAILMCNALAGCLGDGDPSGEGGDGDGRGPHPVYRGWHLYLHHHDNLTRCWQTHVPEDLDPRGGCPADGSTCTGTPPTPRSTGPSPHSMTSPTRRGLSWSIPMGCGVQYGMDLRRIRPNAGLCCAHSARDDVDDVGFIGRVVNLSMEIHNIDTDRMYAR